MTKSCFLRKKFKQIKNINYPPSFDQSRFLVSEKSGKFCLAWMGDNLIMYQLKWRYNLKLRVFEIGMLLWQCLLIGRLLRQCLLVSLCFVVTGSWREWGVSFNHLFCVCQFYNRVFVCCALLLYSLLYGHVYMYNVYMNCGIFRFKKFPALTVLSCTPLSSVILSLLMMTQLLHQYGWCWSLTLWMLCTPNNG